ncbi:3-dehydroquinate dehydratase [Roseovarius sp. TE539]|uniref:DUF2478 domain-containing protein n=1 Tax=Roseovarius sp. TE539 TaxID=2249812 RepID=UPI000DDD6B8C|nr:DUF2478 domain-containing protein [Roseovarius sp. TE539]RBI77501.1 3-dehydroquinate dehydratase [Roseovarius sp. TE539]
MKLAYVMTERRGGTDLALSSLATACLRAGLRPAGLVQINSGGDDGHRCDMDVKVLPDGGTYRISQSLGRQARGCRLDPAALDRAVTEVQHGLDRARPDILIVNKFGKHEAAGRGFRDVIAQALMMDIPVLIGINALNLAAFTEFSDGTAERLAPCPATFFAWLQGAQGTAVA